MKPSILTLLVIFSVFLAPSSVFAAAEFNPNFLISDEELQDWQSMNVSDIQSFLEDKGGYLATLRIEDYVGKNVLWQILFIKQQKCTKSIPNMPW